jgi:hypothetical protein
LVSDHLQATAALFGGHNLVGPTAGLDALEKIKISVRRRDSNNDSSVVSPVASYYTDYAIPVSHLYNASLKLHLIFCFYFIHGLPHNRFPTGFIHLISGFHRALL